MEAGRPEKYTLEFCTTEVQGFLEALVNDDKGDIILLQDLIKDKPYSRQRISEWIKKYDDNEIFSDTVKKIYEILESRLYTNALKGKYNATMAIFGLKNNHNWKDKTETDITTAGEKIHNTSINASELSTEALKEIKDAIRNK